MRGIRVLLKESCAAVDQRLFSLGTCYCEQDFYRASLNEIDCGPFMGSVEFVTDNNGAPYQFFFNTPFGENLENQFVDNYRSFESRFRFNEGQALKNKPMAYFRVGARLPRWQWDEETGNYYYGARYYDPKVSVPALSPVEGWLSVDPHADRYPSISPYAFVANNPLIYIDPDGMAAKPPTEGEFEVGYVHTDADGTWKMNEDKKWEPQGETPWEDDYSLAEVEITAEKTQEQRNAENPVVQAVYQGHNDFLEHPVTQGAMTGLSFMIPVGVGLRFGKGATQAFKAARQAIKVEGTVMQKTFQSLGSLKGLGPLRTSKLLQSKGFVFKGRTQGGYYKYYHPNGAKVQIRPDGQVYRYGGGKGLKYNSDGFFSKLHGQENVLR
jgi:RHS repeat-associated protein